MGQQRRHLSRDQPLPPLKIPHRRLHLFSSAKKRNISVSTRAVGPIMEQMCLSKLTLHFLSNSFFRSLSNSSGLVKWRLRPLWLTYLPEERWRIYWMKLTIQERAEFSTYLWSNGLPRGIITTPQRAGKSSCNREGVSDHHGKEQTDTYVIPT